MSANILPGLLAGLPLSVVFVVYFLVRGQAFMDMTQVGSPEAGSLHSQQLYYMFLVSFALGGLMLGVIGGLVYNRIGPRLNFLGLSLGLALLASILALFSHTSLPWDKVVMNFAVGGILGVLIPLLVTP